MTKHFGHWERNWKTGEWRFICSCGFQITGSKELVMTKAAVHDLGDNEDVAVRSDDTQKRKEE